jgi:hypothetical protein
MGQVQKLVGSHEPHSQNEGEASTPILKPGTGVISTEPSEMIRDFDEDSNINEQDCREQSVTSSS